MGRSEIRRNNAIHGRVGQASGWAAVARLSRGDLRCGPRSRRCTHSSRSAKAAYLYTQMYFSSPPWACAIVQSTPPSAARREFNDQSRISVEDRQPSTANKSYFGLSPAWCDISEVLVNSVGRFQLPTSVIQNRPKDHWSTSASIGGSRTWNLGGTSQGSGDGSLPVEPGSRSAEAEICW